MNRVLALSALPILILYLRLWGKQLLHNKNQQQKDSHESAIALTTKLAT
jgi:hypothetical protein